MNGLHKIGIAGKGLQGGGFVGPEEIPYSILERIEIGEDRPGRLVLQVTPDPLDGIEFRAVGWHPDTSDIVRPAKVSSGMGTAVVQEQAVEAVRESLGEGLHEELEALGMQIRQFQEKPLTSRGFHGPIDLEPLKHVRHHADGLHAIGGEAAPADGAEAEAAFVLAEHPDRTGVRGGNRLLEMFLTGGLEGWDGLRLFLCGSGAAL